MYVVQLRLHVGSQKRPHEALSVSTRVVSLAEFDKDWPAQELVSVNEILVKEEFVTVQLSDGFSI